MITTPDGRQDKYAQIERERRYLLSCLPPALATSEHFQRIVDCYLPHSALRLRRLEAPDGTPLSFKLARKWSSVDLPPEETIITNLYLSAEEYGLLARLPGATLRKRRYPFVHGGVHFSVDQFEKPLDGLILAEMHLFPDMSAVPPCPLPGCLREVTANPAFQGGQLAQLSPEECRRWLAAILGREEEGGR
jgi:CYTH domain-containing protein